MKNKASVVIIGGGVNGCAIAYNLASRGVKDVVVVEKKFLAYGDTGRCGAGIRQQWGTKQNCILAHESMRIFENMNDILQTKRDIELKQGGYLLLAYTEKEVNQFKKNIELQNSMNIPSKAVTPEEAREIVPFLNTENLLGGAYCHTDGHANPFAVTQAYADAAERLGVEINKNTEVIGIKMSGNKIIGVQTDKGYIETEKVVNVAGSWSKEVGDMVGLDIPVYSDRHEILATEPVKQVLKPMVMSFSYNIYCQQVPHGGFVMGHGTKDATIGHNMNSTWQFMEEMAKKVTWLLPPTKNLRIVRHWAGTYNMSPDKQPIVCESDKISGYYIACGFSGHGFMLAPAVGIIMADMITGSKLTWDVTLDIGRFERGELQLEPSVV